MKNLYIFSVFGSYGAGIIRGTIVYGSHSSIMKLNGSACEGFLLNPGVLFVHMHEG